MASILGAPDAGVCQREATCLHLPRSAPNESKGILDTSEGDCQGRLRGVQGTDRFRRCHCVQATTSEI